MTNTQHPTETRALRGRRAWHSGMRAEDLACQALAAQGWAVLGRRLRTAAGEIDIVAERDDVLALVEVKQRASLAEAASALSTRQQARLMAAAEIVLAQFPGHGTAGVRFDVMLVDAAGAVRRIQDAFRLE